MLDAFGFTTFTLPPPCPPTGLLHPPGRKRSFTGRWTRGGGSTTIFHHLISFCLDNWNIGWAGIAGELFISALQTTFNLTEIWKRKKIFPSWSWECIGQIKQLGQRRISFGVTSNFLRKKNDFKKERKMERRLCSTYLSLWYLVCFIRGKILLEFIFLICYIHISASKFCMQRELLFLLLSILLQLMLLIFNIFVVLSLVLLLLCWYISI